MKNKLLSLLVFALTLSCVFCFGGSLKISNQSSFTVSGSSTGEVKIVEFNDENKPNAGVPNRFPRELNKGIDPGQITEAANWTRWTPEKVAFLSVLRSTMKGNTHESKSYKSFITCSFTVNLNSNSTSGIKVMSFKDSINSALPINVKVYRSGDNYTITLTDNPEIIKHLDENTQK